MSRPAPPWSAELVVTVELARHLVETQFPQLAPAAVEPLASGWDNTAYLINKSLVFRFPRRAVAVPLLNTESRLLPLLAPQLPMPIPVPTMSGCPTDEYPWPFAGYEIVPGRIACSAGLSARQRIAMAEPLARFLAALHAFPRDQATRLGLRGDELGRLDPRKRIPMARDNLAKLVRAGLISDSRPWLTILDHPPTARPARTIALVHGDLYARHILVNAAGRPCGVIDWGDAHLGDPAVDLSIAHGLLPPEAHEAFRATYGAVDIDTWHMARFRALYHATVTITYGHNTGDGDLVREGLTVLHHIARGFEQGG